MIKEETEIEEEPDLKQEDEPTKPEPLTPLPGLPEPSLSSQTIEELDSGKEKEALKKIEAALFISGKYMSIPELVALTDVNPLMLKELIKKLDENYETKNSSLEIIEQAGSFKMDVKAEYVNMINKLATGNSEFSRAEQETLAIIAYKQPIKQSIIVKIRGNKAYDHIKNFSQLGLIRAKKLGHTKELSLSDNFYDYFNLGNQEISDDSGIENSSSARNSGEFRHDRNSKVNEEFRHIEGNEGKESEELKKISENG